MMSALIPDCFIRGARSIQPPVPQYTPTSYELNELATSGALPARIAATILLSLMLPTTLTCTFGCALSYSAITLLKTLSSRALQPTQTVSFVGELVRAVAAVAEMATTASVE